MEDVWRGQPAVDYPAHLRPRRAVLLASALERAPPQVSDVMLECAQGGDVGGHGVVIIPAGDHASQPSSLFRDRRVPPPSEFLLEFMQLGAHPVASRLPPKQETAAPGASADMREPQEVETLRLPLTAPLTVRRRPAAELDEARLFLMQREREPRHTLIQARPEPLGVGLVLEAGDDVVGVTHEDNRALGMAFSPLLRPEVEDVMQVDIRQQ